MTQRLDQTPLPPPAPPSLPSFRLPTLDAEPRRRRGGGTILLWLLLVACATVATLSVRRQRQVARRDREALAAARDEAAEHRRARFAAEAEVQRLTAENLQLRTALITMVAKAAEAMKAVTPPAPHEKPQPAP